MDKRQGAGAGKALLSLLCMVWFVASLAGMIYLAGTGGEILMLAVLGQYFLVFGIAGILSNIKNKALLVANLIFPLAGLGLIAVSLWLTYGGERGKEILMVSVPYIAMGAFMVIGILVMAVPYVGAARRRKRCTLAVNAVCVAVDTRYHKGRRTVCPTYEFYYNGENHRVCDHVYYGTEVPEGAICTIYVDPADLKVFWHEERAKRESRDAALMGIVFFVCGLLGMYMMVWGS